ncbi:MAG TPA: mechanosensitive ion channel family protein [Candidatus Paceibacterota bacterium]
MVDLAALQTQYAFLGYEVFGNTVWQLLVAVVVFFLAYTALKLFKRNVIRRLDKLAEKIQGDFDDLVVQILQSVGTPFYLFVSLAVAVRFIEQPEWLKTTVFYIAVAVIVYTVVRGIQQIIDYGFQRGIKKRLQEDPRFDTSAIKLLSKITKGVVWVVALLLVLQNLGYDITALIAGLGIGGIAIAFALQNVLSDVFASFSIYMDRPFQTGDFIIVGDIMGTVQHIGIKSTRIQSLWGEQIIIANKDLTEARVKNYKRMENRRLVFEFGVTYQTPAEKLRKIPEIVQEIVHGIELAAVDRAHFKKFGDSALVFEVMYHVDSPDYNQYMDVQQEINLQLKERLEKEGIEFAYPTQTVYLQKLGERV